MEYVRESWNLLRTPENLIESLESRKDSEFNKNVIISLFNLNSKPNVPAPLFLNYLEILFLHYPDIFLEILSSDSSKEFGLGFIRLINQVGSKFINFINFDDQISTAKCIKNILYFLISDTPTEICTNALKKLTTGLKFPALVALSRIYFENEINDLRNSFREKFFSFNSFFPPSLMMSRLKKSIFHDSIVKELHYHQHNFVSLINWNIIVSGNSTFLTQFSTKKSLILMFIRMVSEYVNNPSLSIAFLIFCTFPKLINENIQQIILYIKKMEKENGTEEEEVEDNQFLLQSNIIEQVLTSESFAELRPSELFDNIYLYPKNILTFSEKLFNLVQCDEILSLYEAIPYLMKYSSDVITYLVLQNQLSDFLLKLAKVCENMQNDQGFYKIWFLFLHYVQNSWSLGSFKIKEMVNSILDKVSNETRFFLSALLTYKSPTFDLKTENVTHFQRSVALLDKMLKSISDKKLEKFNQIVEKSQDFPHFWPSIILNCVCQPSIEYVNLATIAKFPNAPIINVLFNHFMTIVSHIGDKSKSINSNKPEFSNIISYPDYNMMVRFPISDLSELKELLKFHLLEFISSKSLPMYNFNKIACMWRSWITIFGVKKFAGEVIDVLNILTITISVPFDSSIICERLAYMFGSICENEKESGRTRAGSFSEILDQVFDNFGEERFQNQELATGMSTFCISLISLVDQKEGFDQLFNKAFEFAKLCLNHRRFAGESKSTENERFKIASSFAVSFIRKALFIPVMQNVIVEGPFDYLVEIKEWKTLTDFFIVKARLKWKKESGTM
ncbi:hypothetical protein M9Y10_044008 [Tritrichomonas musculus]|uniref:Uncharacterized protein n=1 Tax=Tritrichomonas musculus TaxID=1915356 RepID=A0ABR2K1B8_9EUKA